MTVVCTAVTVLLQVYRGVLRKGGQPVAVKVQRPGVRESIALDIYILRWLAGELCCLLQLTAVSLSAKRQLFVLQDICMQCKCGALLACNAKIDSRSFANSVVAHQGKLPASHEVYCTCV